MELLGVEKKLAKAGFWSEEVDVVLEYITLNVRSFMYANENLANLELIVVAKNTGGWKMFKRIKGHIISDKLDSSYSESRELVCIGSWNIKKAYKIAFPSVNEISVQEVDFKALHTYLFTIAEPTNLTYVVGIEEDLKPTVIKVDNNLLRGLDYVDLKDCIDSTYKRNVHYHQSEGILNTSYYVVSYSEFDSSQE